MLPVTLSLLNSPDSGGRKMGTTPNGTFYQEPVNLLAAQVALRLITADVSLPATPFSFESARDVFGKLNTHDFLTTALTGSNNDLDFLARTPGAQDITVEYRDPAANNAALSVTVHAYLKTALTGSNNDLVFTAVDEGDSGDAITIAFVDPAANSAAESVSVVGKAITFHLATGSGGGITSTGDTLKATLLASTSASALVTAVDAAGNDGSGAVTALAATNLAGHAIVVHLATDSAGTITSTGAQIVDAIAGDPITNLLVLAQNHGSDTGAGVVIALAQTALTGPAGTNPTLDVTLKQTTDPTAALTTHSALAQKTTDPTAALTTHSALAQKTTATTESKTFATVAPYGQWLFDIGGTNTPVFAGSLDRVYPPSVFLWPPG